MRPRSYAAPRLTTSQQATPCAAGLGCGSYAHLIGGPGLVRSSANTLLGNGVVRYIVPPTTRGAPSCPLLTPVAKAHRKRRFLTLLALMSERRLYRVLAWSRAAMCHSPSSTMGCASSA